VTPPERIQPFGPGTLGVGRFGFFAEIHVLGVPAGGGFTKNGLKDDATTGGVNLGLKRINFCPTAFVEDTKGFAIGIVFVN
jgi:hypothetical protein